jgi:hypothetical protein
MHRIACHVLGARNSFCCAAILTVTATLRAQERALRPHLLSVQRANRGRKARLARAIGRKSSDSLRRLKCDKRGREEDDEPAVDLPARKYRSNGRGNKTRQEVEQCPDGRHEQNQPPLGRFPEQKYEDDGAADAADELDGIDGGEERANSLDQLRAGLLLGTLAANPSTVNTAW